MPPPLFELSVVVLFAVLLLPVGLWVFGGFGVFTCPGGVVLDLGVAVALPGPPPPPPEEVAETATKVGVPVPRLKMPTGRSGISAM